MHVGRRVGSTMFIVRNRLLDAKARSGRDCRYAGRPG